MNWIENQFNLSCGKINCTKNNDFVLKFEFLEIKTEKVPYLQWIP